MKKCIGCGITLQDSSSNVIGYVKDINQQYCQRCFRLTHYGDINNYNIQQITNEEIFNIYQKYKNSLFVLIVDILDVFSLENDNFLENFKNYKTYLVFNKIDILPDNNYQKISKHFYNLVKSLHLNYPNIVGMSMFTKYDDNLKKDLFDALNNFINDDKQLIFLGRANAGKSTIINRLLENTDLTTSIYPGTTLNEVKINIDDYTIIDTPGLIDKDNALTHLSLQDYKKYNLNKQIKPKTFQFNSNQSYFYDGLLYFDIYTDKNASITFYMNNDIDIHRSKLEKSIEYYEKHYLNSHNYYPLTKDTYYVDKYLTFVFKGLGLVKINGDCRAVVHFMKDTIIYTWKENI